MWQFSTVETKEKNIQFINKKPEIVRNAKGIYNRLPLIISYLLDIDLAL